MAHALDTRLRPASTMAVASWVKRVAGVALADKASMVAQAESSGVVTGRRAAGRVPEVATVTDVGSVSGLAAPSGGGLERLQAAPQTEAGEAVAPGAAPPSRAPSRRLRYAGILGTVVAVVAVGAFVFTRGPAPEPGGVFAAAGPAQAAAQLTATPPTTATAPPSAIPSGAASSAVIGAVPVPSGSAEAPKTGARPGTLRGSHPGATKPETRSDLNHLLDTR